ncbi:MAG: OmpA family protein [Desulfovibrio sp.]|jgi:chemotaxis protein MotB|nr:OmpA family protein [Desulfovibrio sp.]
MPALLSPRLRTRRTVTFPDREKPADTLYSRSSARKAAPGSGTGTPVWLITFADLMTLLLVFFILLLTMSGLDKNVVSKIGGQMRGQGENPAPPFNPGAGNIDIFANYLRKPKDIPGNAEKALDAFIAMDQSASEAFRTKVHEQAKVLGHPEGVVIVLTDGLLFAAESPTLNTAGKKLLDLLTPVILDLNVDINISGHTDSGAVESGFDPGALYELSYFKAAAVLEHFLQGKVPAGRLSVSGYGSDKTMYPEADAKDRQKNNRLEILLKTMPRTASYI